MSPTIGSIWRRPGVAAAREARYEAARWRMRRGLTDVGVRLDAEHQLLGLYEDVRIGRRYDAIARVLRDLADRLDCAQDEADAALDAAASWAEAA